MPIKQKKNKPTPAVAYDVQVSVDRNGKFTYKANGKEASTLIPNLGDKISWSVKLRGRKTAFQVEFPGIAPFEKGRVFRSASKPTTPPATVALPPHYKGNLVFKYTVTVSNGWSDDPVIGPVPADPLMLKLLNTQIILLSVDQQTGVLTIKPPAAGFVKGAVTWQWDPQSAYTDDFVLKFDQPGAGTLSWPPSTNSQAQRIVLNMQVAGNDGYTITTVNTGLSAPGTLTIN